MPEHEPRTFFKEHEHDAVKGFTVLGHEDGEYHIGEKWLAADYEEATSDDDVWMEYWVSEAQLERRVSEGNCEPKGKLTDEQFAAVKENVGLSDVGENHATAEA